MMPHADIHNYAIRCALGDNVEQVVTRMIHGERVIASLPFEQHNYAIKYCAPIASQPKRTKNKRFARRMDLFGIETATEAANHPLITSHSSERIGIFVGYGGLRAHWDEMMPSLMHQKHDLKNLWDNGLRAFHPFWMLRHLSNNAHALCASELGAQGEGTTLAGANAGAQALSSAILALHTMAIDVAVVFAYDSLIQPDVLVELATNQRAHSGSARPIPAYHPNCSGFIPSEAAAALLLTRPNHAPDALAQVWAACGADGNKHLPTLDTLKHTISQLPHHQNDSVAIDGAALAIETVDQAEIQLLKTIAPKHTLTATTNATGYTGAAQSIVQAITLTCAMRRGLLPNIIYNASENISSALALNMFAPGLTGAIKITIPPTS